MLLPTSNFSASGVDVANNSRNMAYLYGLSDFFTTVFEDRDTINLMLEANALAASDIYSRFLQMTSSISLEKIQTDLSVQMKLLFITQETDAWGVATYKIDGTISGAAYIADKPFLPTKVLENDVDFGIYQTDTDTTLYLARPIYEYGFSQRITADGHTQYAIWLVDAVLDERMMYDYYGKLVGATNKPSSDTFSNFIYGLYYLYFNGPTLDAIQKGANLALGIPLCRVPETVIDIRTYLDTDQYLIITDQNQYLLPVGIVSNVNIGDALTPGQAVAQVIQIMDYESDGVWWLNISIPPSIIATVPSSQKNRLANQGTFFYDLMNNYLKNHTFLVKINVGAFQNDQYFDTMFEIINNTKPAHSQPIFVWNIDVGEDNAAFVLNEDSFSVSQNNATAGNALNEYSINSKTIG